MEEGHIHLAGDPGMLGKMAVDGAMILETLVVGAVFPERLHIGHAGGHTEKCIGELITFGGGEAGGAQFGIDAHDGTDRFIAFVITILAAKEFVVQADVFTR